MESEQVLESQSIFEGKILNLRMDVVTLPDGSEASREVVEHRPAVVVVPVDSENNVILTILPYKNHIIFIDRQLLWYL